MPINKYILFLISLITISLERPALGDVTVPIDPSSWNLFIAKPLSNGITSWTYRTTVSVPEASTIMLFNAPSTMTPTFSSTGISFLLAPKILNGGVTMYFSNYGAYPGAPGISFSETISASGSGVVCNGVPLTSGTLTGFGTASIQCGNTSTSPIMINISSMDVTFAGVFPSPTPSTSPTPTPTPSASPTPDPSSSPTPDPTPSSDPSQASYALKLDFKKPTSTTENGVQKIILTPSVDGCGQLKTLYSEKSLRITCINKASGNSIGGCRYSAKLRIGKNDGGHQHDSVSRPLGTLVLDDSISLPINGLDALYSAPEIGGDVLLELSGTAPDGSILSPAFAEFEIKVGDFKPLGNDGLIFDVKSHREGDSGNKKMKDRLVELVKEFEVQVRSNVGYVVNVPILESESASLPRGGLFDIEYVEGSPWLPPHCGHRDGETADISYSTFEAYPATTREYLIKAFKNALEDSNFRSQLEITNSGKHWHIHTKLLSPR